MARPVARRRDRATPQRAAQPALHAGLETLAPCPSANKTEQKQVLAADGSRLHIVLRLHAHPTLSFPRPRVECLLVLSTLSAA